MNGVRLVGLHNHTTASDGYFTPQVLIDQALKQGYETLAITDHNTVHGWMDLDLPPTVLGGIEVSGVCQRTNTEVHLLGYGLKLTPELLTYSQQFADFYAQAWQETLHHLGAPDAPTAPHERPRTIEALVQKGIPAQSIVAEWCRTQSILRNLDMAPPFLEYLEAIAMLHRAGAIVSVAHPQRYPQAMSEELLHSVDAIEVYHPSHPPHVARFWRDTAVRLDKGVTGGHDFHGWSEPARLPLPLRLADDRFITLAED
ncbi:PHP domain-containing protein [Anthocerotibacter panamensis]|uniref:PHP domain-containing protein n=1 Tax=Anthocerotibacter panamensis TaxID=2857077 RepID=UPI001C40419F|nr:PHP domain-containing protein [Anthocerotibacter panamensis]